MASLLYNGTQPKAITYNGADVKKVIYNGVTVWSKTTIDKYVITVDEIDDDSQAEDPAEIIYYAKITIKGVTHFPIKYIDTTGGVYSVAENKVSKNNDGSYKFTTDRVMGDVEYAGYPDKGVEGYSIIVSINGKAVNK